VDIDWSEKGPSPDQARIERALLRFPPRPADRILHIGVGNSELARKFSSRVERIDGITLAKREKNAARTLGLPNYTVHLLNKYTHELRFLFPNQFDYIVDNNPASFACCTYHLDCLFDNYFHCLRTGGRVLTDQTGLDWTADGTGAWGLTFNELSDLGFRFQLEAARITNTVYELRLQS